MAKVNKQVAASYRALQGELDAVLSALQQDDVDIDETLRYYQRGLELIEQLQHYLTSAENTVSTLQAKHRTSP